MVHTLFAKDLVDLLMFQRMFSHVTEFGFEVIKSVVACLEAKLQEGSVLSGVCLSFCS